MYINEQYKLIMLGVPKNASSSLNYALNTALGVPSEPIFEATQIKDGHPSLADFLEVYDLDTTGYTIAAVIRNPYERVVSGCANTYPDFAERPRVIMLDQLTQGTQTFLRKQTDYTDGANVIMRIETLQAELDAMLSILGAPQVQLPWYNTSAHDHYSTYYDSTLRNMVQRAYAREFEQFGYTFDAP